MTTTHSEVLVMTNADARFYKLIGPFLGRREVHRAVGSPVYDDDEKTWLVALDGRRVAGFLSYRPQHGAIVAESCYIAKREGTGEDSTVRAALLRKLIAVTTPSPVRSMVPKAVVGTYAAAGFTELPEKTTKNFISLVRSAA